MRSVFLKRFDVVGLFHGVRGLVLGWGCVFMTRTL